MRKSNACMQGRHLDCGRNKPSNRETSQNYRDVAVTAPSTQPPTYVVQMQGKRYPHHHHRTIGHKAVNINDLRQLKRERICAADCGSPHQTSVSVSCRHSLQPGSHVVASIGTRVCQELRQEVKPSRTQTNQHQSL